ncbi:hypothetical protein CTZ27_25780 [Streptomyces griseocarneus]|nr:hypothetical protein CTZ27_25780 [Streptomyces griseocarneus]
MPTPYGSRGGMAFSADELRVLRRALAIALDPRSVPNRPTPERAEEVREYLRLAESVDEAAREGGRLRAFLLADLARYRAALPGAAAGYTERLQDAIAAGYQPGAEDLAALRALCSGPSGGAEADRRRALLHRCEHLAELAVRARLAERAVTPAAVPASRPQPGRTRLLALPGGRAAGAAATGALAAAVAALVAPGEPRESGGPGEPGERESLVEVKCELKTEQESGMKSGPMGERKSEPKPAPKPAPGPAPAAPKPPRTDRPIPTPGEVFPPRRKPSPQAGAADSDPAARPA